MSASAAFWRGKRVLVTGHTGFKGSWLTLWLSRLGADVTGIALAPSTRPNLFEAARVGECCRSILCDVRDLETLAGIVRRAEPEVVLHLAAQPLVRAGYREPVATFATNVMGTVHLLEALRTCARLRVVVAVTSDKVYRNDDTGRFFGEDDALGGHDPYSASKAAAEIAAACYRDAFLAGQGVAVATARAGNVIGGGDWSEDRLVPDAMRAWNAGKPLLIRHPRAVRPWQHVLDALAGYLVFAERLWHEPGLAGAYNFGPDAREAIAVGDLVAMMRAAYGHGDIVHAGAPDGPREAAWLGLDAGRARDRLGVTAMWPIAAAVERTMVWYRAYRDGADAASLCRTDIEQAQARLIESADGACGRS